MCERECACEPSTVVLMLDLNQVMSTGFGVPRHPLFFLGYTSAPEKTLDFDAEAPNDEPGKVYCMECCRTCLLYMPAYIRIEVHHLHALDKHIHAAKTRAGPGRVGGRNACASS